VSRPSSSVPSGKSQMRQRARKKADRGVELDRVVRRASAGAKSAARQEEHDRGPRLRAPGGGRVKRPKRLWRLAVALMRGAPAGREGAIATSARRLPRTTKNAVNMIMPIRIGYSFIVRASTKSRPMPGQPKIDSVTKCAREEHRQIGAEEGNQRLHRVGKGMAEEPLARPQSLGAGGPHVVLVQHLEEGGGAHSGCRSR